VIVYLDSSVLLRFVMDQQDKLSEWSQILAGVTSELTEVECLRTLDRLRMQGSVSDAALSASREAIFRFVRSIEVVEISRLVLQRACWPLPTTLGTLDAIHLNTAMLWQESAKTELVMATHDRAMARAARATGLAVVGVAADR